MTTPRTTDSPAMQRILRALAAKPNMSVSDLSAEAFVGVTTLACGGYIQALKTKQRIFISGWRQSRGRFSTPLYSIGNHPDIGRPRVDDSNRDAPGMWRILHTLERYGPLTHKEIARHSGLSPNTVKNSGYLAALIAQQRIHVSGWKRAISGPMQPVYQAGSGTAVEKPVTLSAAQRNRRYRERKSLSAHGAGLLQLLVNLQG